MLKYGQPLDRVCPTGEEVANYVTAAIPQSTAGLNNFQRLPKWRTALAKVLAGSAQAKVCFIGDSTTSANDATTGLVGAQPWTPAAQLAKLATARGYSVRADSVMGQQASSLNTPTLYNGYDARTTLGANIGVGQTVFGFSAFNDSAGTGAAADTLTFKPAGAFDTLEVYTLAHSGWGSIAVNVDGGSTVVTINTSQGTNTFQKTVQTVTRVTGGTHNINLVCTGNCFIAGVLAYDSTVPSVNCLNFGWSGGTLAQLITSNSFPWNPGFTSVSGVSGLGCYAPDLTVIFIGLNDLPAGQNTPLATFQSYLQTLIGYAQVTGDCIVKTLFGNGIDTNTNTLLYNAAIAAAARNMGIAYIDQFTQYGPQGNGQILGLLGTDNTHPTHAGYADGPNVLANAIFNLI